MSKLFKKFGEKVSRAHKFGHKAAKSVGFGLKKGGRVVGRVADKVATVATLAAPAAAAVNPVAGAAVESVAGAAATVGAAARIAQQAGAGLEKIGKKQYKDGFEDLQAAHKEAKSRKFV